MKKNFLLLFTLLLLALVGTGCGDKVSGSLGKDGAELVGTWNGVGNALGRDDSYSCDYLSFSIDKEGTFTLKDIAQNKTCLSGSLSAKSEVFLRYQRRNHSGTSFWLGRPRFWQHTVLRYADKK